MDEPEILLESHRESHRESPDFITARRTASNVFNGYRRINFSFKDLPMPIIVR